MLDEVRTKARPDGAPIPPDLSTVVEQTRLYFFYFAFLLRNRVYSGRLFVRIGRICQFGSRLKSKWSDQRSEVGVTKSEEWFRWEGVRRLAEQNQKFG